MIKPLYLYGPPASGKTTLAKKLALEWGRMYVDLDEAIEQKVGCSVREFFERHGEAAFRAVESETLREVNAPIIALGGGTLLDPQNRAFVESKGFVAVLDVSEDALIERIVKDGNSRPLGNMFAQRCQHYASFEHRIKSDTKVLLPRKLRGCVTLPCSKSHLHRLLIAEFLASGTIAAPSGHECDDIKATRNCILSLIEAQKNNAKDVVLDCSESGSTLRFLAPIVAALGLNAKYIKRGRLNSRPIIEYATINSGVLELRGDISSQFVTGLLFALPLLHGDSVIKFTTPLQSRGYVDLTLDVLRSYGIDIVEAHDGFVVKGSQKYISPGVMIPELDWSSAAFWFAANAIGNSVTINGLSQKSMQPDAQIAALIDKVISGAVVDVSSCPDNYPALAVVNKALGCNATFTGTERLKIKESDRLTAMEQVLANPYDVDPCNDHRIAMAAAIYSTVLSSPILIHSSSCVAKSYPQFFDEFKMDLYAVTGWPLVKTSSPKLHNAAHALLARKAEMVAYPAKTISEAMLFAQRANVKGMAVTIPHKQSVIEYLDEVEEQAAKIGAVNTVVFSNGRKIGYNTDEPGFAKAILEFTKLSSLVGVKTALLGNGGAAKAVGVALERLGAKVEVFYRRPLTQGFALIVNATPVDPIPEYTFTGSEMVYDLRYEPKVTPLMERALAAGCIVENGFSMLKAQAEFQLKLF